MWPTQAAGREDYEPFIVGDDLAGPFDEHFINQIFDQLQAQPTK
jgi:hypothetical protein